MVTTTDSGNRPSHADIIAARSAALTAMRQHASAITLLGEALADVDAALVLAIDQRNVDDDAALVTAARRLSTLLDGSAVAR